MDAVSQVLVARADRSDGLNSMLGASVIGHVVLVGVFVFLPAAWFGADNDAPETVMQISLGGPDSPDTQGLTSAGGRPIQQVQPELKKAVEPVRPPSAKTPEMVEPTKAPPKKATPNKVDAKDPKSNRPTKGQEIQSGTAVAETNARGQGFGMSSGGFGSQGHLEVSNFCCPEYLGIMRTAIMANWNSQAGAAGTTHLRFVIQKDGRIVDISVEQSSGIAALDLYARRALMLTKLPPLPAAFPEAALAVHLYFEYRR